MTVPKLTINVLKSELQTVTSKFEKDFALNEASLDGLQANADELKLALKKLEAAIEKLQERQSEVVAKLAAFDERFKSLEKSNDRTWQFAAMVISAVSLIVSLIVAFVKK